MLIIGLIHLAVLNKISPDGYGVKPHTKIIPTYQDRLNGKDPELDWIITNANQKKP